MKKAALYNPYLDTLGGGEKHVLSILKVLQEEGFEISIFWDKHLQSQIEDRFSLQFNQKLKFLPNIFNPQEARVTGNFIKKLMILSEFDIFFYVTDGSYFLSSAKKNFVFCMVPYNKLYRMTLLNKLKTSNFRFITNSRFTQSWMKKWDINSEIIYPYLNQEFIDLNIQNLNKGNTILSIGRFYSHLHSKKQSILINLFKKLKQQNKLFKHFKLILAGGLKIEDKIYLNKLKSQVTNSKDIKFKINVPYRELINLYKKSLIYIHTAGYGVDENKNPHRVEHLGIAPLEAMASGCITFCYNAGGPKEIIQDGKTGFLFGSQSELNKKLFKVLSNLSLQNEIKSAAKKFVKDKYGYEVFRKRVKE